MSFPKPIWNRDHIEIPNKLFEYINDGFELLIRVKRKVRLTTLETTLKKDYSLNDSSKDSKWEKQVNLERYVPAASDLLDQGFELIVKVSKTNITVSAEKIL